MPFDYLIHGRRRRLVLCAVAVAVALPVIYSGIVELAVARLQREGTINSLRLATRYEPGDSELWWVLASHYERDPIHRNLSQAAACLEQATRLDPGWSRYWEDLGQVQEEEGDISAAREDYQRAKRVGPGLADVAWRYGSFLLRHGDMGVAASEIRGALQGVSDLTPSAISQFQRAGAGVQFIVDRVLPPSSSVLLDAIDYFVARKENDAAVASWEKLAGLGQEVRLARSFDLIQNLIDANRLHDADRVWRQALTLAGRPNEAEAGGSLIFNGGFEHDLVNGGFDWRQTPAAGTAFDLVTDVTEAGSQSARVVFDGSANVDYGNLVQYVPLTPGEGYRFTAYMRTDSISSDSGPQFQLQSCSNPLQVVAETPAMTGTHPWTEAQAEFRASSALDCLRVVLRRKPSELLASKISGTVWVDDVRLQKAATYCSARPLSAAASE